MSSKKKNAIFRKRRCKDIVNPVFAFNGEVINNEDDFTYLGIVFMSNGSFCKNKSKLVHQGRKALYSILKKSRKLNLPIDLQIDLFDTMPHCCYMDVRYGALKMMIIFNPFV